MNSSQFMDKQIMELSGSQGGELFDLMKEGHHDNGGVMKNEEILPSYDFQPIRSVGSSPSMNSGLDGPRLSRGLADSKMGSSNLRFSGILEPHELAKVKLEKESDSHDVSHVTAMAEIDHTVKKHADNLLHALEGVSSRLSQLESRTRHLENSVDELKVSIGSNNSATDGKLGQLENILREVQTGLQVLRDKQDIAEAQRQASMGDHPPSQSAPRQPVQQLPQTPVAPPPPLPSLPAPNAPQPPLQQNPFPVQFPAQLPQTQVPSLPSLPREPYFLPPGQPTDTAHQQYQMPAQQLQLPPPPPAQHYQPPPQVPQYSQPVQPVNPSPQFQSPLPYQPEESAPHTPPPQTYNPTIHQPSGPQTYNPTIHQPSGPQTYNPTIHQPSGPGPTPPQQYYGSHPGMYEPPATGPGLGQLSFSGGYGPPPGPSFSEPYPYSGSPSHYSGSIKPTPFSPSGHSSGGSNYPRLPTAHILPQAQPVGSSSGGATGDRASIDDVVDQVSTMGFSRDQVRETVQRLTENGQSVDLNAVLDKLMNDGEIQPQSGWFGR